MPSVIRFYQTGGTEVLKLETVPDILEHLASVQMHAIQTSGNCIRNVTADHMAGIAKDEVDDPRPYCEIIRQWSTHHPEFTYLPRKFKIAVTGSPEDRAASEVHDVGLHLKRDAHGQIGFEAVDLERWLPHSLDGVQALSRGAAAVAVRGVRHRARDHLDRPRHPDLHHLRAGRAGAAAADGCAFDRADGARLPVHRLRAHS